MSERHEVLAKSLFQESNDAFFLFDLKQHRLLDLNPAALRLIGLSRSEAKARCVWDLFQSQQSGGLSALLDCYGTTGFFEAREGFVLRSERGSDIPVAVHVSIIHIEPEPLGLVVARDVTAEKAAQRELARLVELSPDLLGFVELDGDRFSLSNPNASWARVLGKEPSQLLGTSLLDHVHADDRGRCRDTFMHASEGGTFALELRMVASDGSIRWIEWRGLREGSHASVVGRDTTSEHETARLEHERSGLEAESRAKTRFLAELSHEVRTPLAAILDYSRLSIDASDEASASRHLSVIRQNAEHLIALIDDLLDLSTIEAGAIRIEHKLCDGSQILDEVVEALQGRAEAKGLRLEAHRLGILPGYVDTDPVRLREILFNLVSNAVKYTETGHVAVRIETRYRPDGPRLLFHVTDTGPGMTSEELSLVSMPYYRGAKARSGNVAGVGLGLAISQRLAALLGGEIRATSRLGQGSTFTLEIPGPTWTAVPASVPTPASETADITPSVLLVDDNEPLREAMRMHLEANGVSVVTANHGRHALDLYDQAAAAGSTFDAVFLDLRMPAMDGHEVARRLRSRGYEGLVLALSASDVAELAQDGARDWFDAFELKPVRDWPRLVNWLRARIGRRRRTLDSMVAQPVH